MMIPYSAIEINFACCAFENYFDVVSILSTVLGLTGKRTVNWSWQTVTFQILLPLINSLVGHNPIWSDALVVFTALYGCMPIVFIKAISGRNT